MVSRVARNPIQIPDGVDIKLTGTMLTVKGKLAELAQEIHPFVKVDLSKESVQLSPIEGEQTANALSGTMAALVKNMIHGVSQGFERKLLLVGVGYRAKAQGKTLDLSLGFSHPVNLEMPEGVSVDTPTQTEVVFKGADKQQVNQMAAKVRKLRPVEPYKGKGFRYSDEEVIKKEAKKK